MIQVSPSARKYVDYFDAFRSA